MRLAAVRRLAYEAADTGLLGPELAAGIRRVKGSKKLGMRLGNWLTADEARTLWQLPNAYTPKGKRDRAILAILLGCGLRRGELIDLTFDHLQRREDHWAIVDLIGKAGHVRTVPMPDWVKRAIDDWLNAADIRQGKLFRCVCRRGTVWGAEITEKVVWHVVKEYATKLGVSKLAPHDLRRSCARLCHTAGGELEQIQFLLGHVSVQTTEKPGVECLNIFSLERTAFVRATNPEGRITRRGFLKCGSAALASVGLIGNAHAAESLLSSKSVLDSAKPGSEPPAGKIALEEHFVLAETIEASYEVRDLHPETRQRILDLGSGRIADMDRGGLDICILSLTAPGVQGIPQVKEAIAQARRTNDYLAENIAKNPKRRRTLPSRQMQMLLAKPEHDSSAEPEIVLAVIQPVRDFCQEVLGLYGANGDVLGHFEINAAACRHRKIVFCPR